MGLFSFIKSKNKNIDELNKHYSVIFNMLDRKINLIKDGKVKDEIARVESESFVINLYKDGVLNLFGLCSVDNRNGHYKEDESGKVLTKDVIVKIINSDNLEYLKDDIFYMHTFLSLKLNK